MTRTNRRRGFTLAELLVAFIPTLIIVVCWIGNLVKLCRCDFAAPYKGEVIHAVGVFIPPAAVITVWFNDK